MYIHIYIYKDIEICIPAAGWQLGKTSTGTLQVFVGGGSDPARSYTYYKNTRIDMHRQFTYKEHKRTRIYKWEDRRIPVGGWLTARADEHGHVLRFRWRRQRSRALIYTLLTYRDAYIYKVI